jgi:hypothetical protein
MPILLMVIDGYSIGEYWCLLMVIILMVIGGTRKKMCIFD